jgi:protein SCO1/2
MTINTKPQASSNPAVLSVTLFGLFLVCGLVVFLLMSDDLRDRNMGGADGKLGGQFTLQSVDGDVSLSDFKGKVVMLYFGFVNCSQVCPVSMKVMQDTLDSMQPTETDSVQVLLVSVDVENDNVDAVDQYVKKFRHDFIGLAGTNDQIINVVDEYGAYFAPTELKETDESRAYRHSSRYYLVNQNGELVDAMRHGSTPNELRARLRQVLATEFNS